jgi:hypothetical protein
MMALVMLYLHMARMLESSDPSQWRSVAPRAAAE